MEGISSTHAAWAIMDEDAEQRMADTRRFFAEIGGRATSLAHTLLHHDMRLPHNNRTRCSSTKQSGMQGDETSPMPARRRTSTRTAMCFCTNTKTHQGYNHNNKIPKHTRYYEKKKPLCVVFVKKKKPHRH